MKKSAQKIFVLAVTITLAILIAGCEEQNLSGTKKTRLIAAENIQLRKQLKQRNKEIEKQEGLLDKCLQTKKVLEGKSQNNVENLVNKIFKDIAEESKKVHDENEKLKTQIEELKKQLEEAEKK